MKLDEYEFDLYKNRFRLGVPSTLLERAEEVLGEEAFQNFLEHVHEGKYSQASSAFARAVKDSDTEITDTVRELYARMKAINLTGDDDLIPDWAKENVRERMLWEAQFGILDPEKLADLEANLKRVLDSERLLLKLADRMDVSPVQLQNYIEEALEEIAQLAQLVT